MISVATLIHYWPSALGPGVGMPGILIAIIAHRRAAAAEQAAGPEVTVRTRRSMPAA